MDLGLVDLVLKHPRIDLAMKQESTSAPATTAVRPVFIRVSDVTRTYGLKRGFLYHMVKSGRLKSTVLKGRCGMKGIVLFRPEDIETLIKTQSMRTGR